MTKIEATKRGKALHKRMKGKGWKVRVWENIGWHYSVINGPLSVSPAGAMGKFFCLLNDAVESCPGCGLALWSIGDYRSKDPNKVVLRATKRAREVTDRLDEAVAFAEKVCG